MSEQTKTEHPMTDAKLAEIRARAEAESRSLLLKLNPMVPVLIAPGREDWVFNHRLSEDVTEFGWKEAEETPEIARLLVPLKEKFATLLSHLAAAQEQQAAQVAELERVTKQNRELEDRISALMGEIGEREASTLESIIRNVKSGMMDAETAIREAVQGYQSLYNYSCELRERDQRDLQQVVAERDQQEARATELYQELTAAIEHHHDKVEELSAELERSQKSLAKWESDPLKSPEANPIDTIASHCGWLPLKDGEEMTVHFNRLPYVIRRGERTQGDLERELHTAETALAASQSRAERAEGELEKASRLETRMYADLPELIQPTGKLRPGCRVIIRWKMPEGWVGEPLVDRGYVFIFPNEGEDIGAWVHVPRPDAGGDRDVQPEWKTLAELMANEQVASIEFPPSKEQHPTHPAFTQEKL